MKSKIQHHAIIIICCLFFYGCDGDPRVNVTVKGLRDVDKLESGKRCFLYCSVKDKSNSDLEFKEVKGMVSALLRESGYGIVEKVDDADLVVPIYYSISDKKTSTWNRPIYNMSGGTTTFQANTYSGYGSTSTYGSVNQPYKMQYAGSVTETDVYFIRSMNIAAANKEEALKSKEEFPIIWETRALSSGSSGSVLEIVPYMVYAMRGKLGKRIIDGVEMAIPKSDKQKKEMDSYFGYESGTR